MTETSSSDNDRPAATARQPLDVLAQAVAAGEVADLGGARIEAAMLQRLITGQYMEGRACRVTPFGVRIRDAECDGRLDLEGADIPFPLVFARLTMLTGGQRGSLTLRDARVRRLNISDCTFAGGIAADRARFENGIIIAGSRISGPLSVRGSEIGGALAIEGVHLGDGKIAMLAAGARISGPLVLARARCHGEIRLQRTRLEAGLRADSLAVDGEGAGIYCDAARCGGDVIFTGARIGGPLSIQNTTIDGGVAAAGLVVVAPEEGINATGLDVRQSIDLTAAAISGPLVLDGATIAKRFTAPNIEINGGDIAISADIVRIGGNWELPDARLVGQLRCPGARIGGQLRATACRIYGGDIAIRADGAEIDGGVFFSRAVISGSVRFPAAKVNNQFRFSAATIKVADGVALIASGALLNRDVELNAGFQTIGGVVLDQVRIRGDCDLTASHIKSAAIVRAATGPAGSTARPIATPTPSRALPDEIAISLVDATIARLEMPVSANERPRGVVDLSRARVGAYVDWAATWPTVAGSRQKNQAAEPADHLVLDGFTYEHLENPAGIVISAGRDTRRRERAGERRIIWLLGQAAADTGSRFKPQAWVYLSQQLIRQGLDRDAREVTIERRRRERQSRWSTPSARWENRFLDWFALYGFNPWRTVAWMAIIVAIYAGIWSWSAANCAQRGCFDERVFVTSKRDSYAPGNVAERYPAFQPLAYAFDVFIPFVSFGYEDHWRPNINYGPVMTVRLPDIPAFLGGETAPGRIWADVTMTTGGMLYVLMIFEKILGLVLTSLMLTGFTGLLRSHE